MNTYTYSYSNNASISIPLHFMDRRITEHSTLNSLGNISWAQKAT